MPTDVSALHAWSAKSYFCLHSWFPRYGKVFIGAPSRVDWASIYIVDRSRCLTKPITANRRRAMNNDGNVATVAAFDQCSCQLLEQCSTLCVTECFLAEFLTTTAEYSRRATFFNGCQTSERFNYSTETLSAAELVPCPGSCKMCSGEQWCLGFAGSSDLTVPCSTASAGYDICQSTVRLKDNSACDDAPPVSCRR